MKNPNKPTFCTIALFSLFLFLSAGCSIGDDESQSKLTDIDGNEYTTVTIGTQVWMVENLKVTRYHNGDAIETTSPASADISSETSPKYQWCYDGNENNAEAYGRLYTWYTITDERGLCPSGWHVPTDNDWNILIEYLTSNGYSEIGKALASTTGWENDTLPGSIGNNQTANNGTGFSGLPGGKRGSNGTFIYLGKECKWWSSSESGGGGVGRSLTFDEAGVSYVVADKKDGRSIRCVKD